MSVGCSRRLALIVVMLCLVSPSLASGGTLTSWTGGGGNGNWTTVSNWNPSGNAPTASTSGTTYSLVFGGTTQPITTNNLGTVSIDSMSFTNAGGTGQNVFFTISGGTLAFQSASITTSSASGSPFVSNSDGNTISSAMTLSGTTTVTLGALHNLSLTGAITGSGALVFDDASPGTVEYTYLSGSNSYSGGTQIRGGFVQTGVRSPASSSNNNALGSGSVTISDNGTLLVRNNSVITNTLTVSGSGSSGNSMTGSFGGAAGGLAEYRGAITVAGATRFSTASSVAGDATSKFLISGSVDLGSNVLTLRSGSASGATAGLAIEVSGTISGAGGLVIEGASANGRVLLSSSNSYSGGTTITTGTLTVGNGSALGTGFLAVNTSGLDLNGQALTVGALSGSSSGVIQSMVAGAASLTTTAATDSTYNGTIINGDGSAVVGLTKAGVGALTLTNSNSYTGPTTINGGNLVVDNQFAIGSSGNVKFGGGTLKYTANNQVDYSSRIKTSGSAISIDTNGQNVTFASGIDSSNTGGLTKRGAGTLFINGSNSYTGNSLVEAGTLGGNGTIAGTVTVGTNAFISPGSTAGAIGTLSVGALELQSGATASMQISGTAAGLYDQIASLNSVTYGGALAIDFTTGGFANFDVWQLFSGTSHGGNFSSVTATGAYGALTFNYLGNGEWKATGGLLADGQSMSFYVDNSQAIGGRYQAGQLVLVPEPSAFALMGIGVAVFGWRSVNRRRRMAGRLRADSADDQAAD